MLNLVLMNDLYDVCMLLLYDVYCNNLLYSINAIAAVHFDVYGLSVLCLHSHVFLQFHFWCEFVPVFKLEREEALMVEEWVKLEAFQKVFGTPQELGNMTAESG